MSLSTMNPEPSTAVLQGNSVSMIAAAIVAALPFF